MKKHDRTIPKPLKIVPAREPLPKDSCKVILFCKEEELRAWRAASKVSGLDPWIRNLLNQASQAL